MYCQSWQRRKSILFCSSFSLGIHILILCILFITYHVKNSVSSHLLHLIPVVQDYKPASVIFQQPSRAHQQTPQNTVAESSHPQAPQTTPISDALEREASSVPQQIVPPSTRETDVLYVQPSQPVPYDTEAVRKQRAFYTKVYKPNPKLKQLFQAFSSNIQEEKEQKATPKAQTYDFVMDDYKRKLALFFTRAVCYKPNTLYGAEPIKTVAEICITFNDKGVVTKFELKHSLPKYKLQSVENTLKKLIYSSGLFPPIPRTLKPHDTYTFSLFIYIQIHEGIHNYSVIHR